MPEVQSVATCSFLPLNGASGNNVFETGKDQNLFNIADLYSVDAGYLSLMEIPVVEGNGFQQHSSDMTQVLISQAFARKLSIMLNWKDGVVAKISDLPNMVSAQ